MQNNHQEAGGLAKRILVGLFGSLIVSLILTALIAVPVLFMIPYFLAFPLWAMWPELETTGDLIEAGFMWVTIKQDWVWLVFFAYFFFITFLPFCIWFVVAHILRRSLND